MTNTSNSSTSRTTRRRKLGVAALLLTGLMLGSGSLPSAVAEGGYQRISGEGSSWAGAAIDAMRVNVRQFGVTVDYGATGSSAGRKNFLNGTVDFAASDIPFQFEPEDGSAPEKPAPGSYAYMPVVAGGTAFMYNLKINGKRVTNLRLSGENVVKIFTKAITTWNDPALQADNPGIILPAKPITPVVRSDGSGSSALFTKWMIDQYPALWTKFCNDSGRAPKCGFTSYYPTVQGMIAQAGDLGVAGYVAASYAEGAIGYVNYAYALGNQFPVAKVLNAAGYYTEPTPENVAVSLLKAQINTDESNPAVYLTQQLEGVYTDTDPRSYQLSSYSYLILPTTIAGQFNIDKGRTLGFFAYYAMCQAQQQSASLGYSPMPLNLVEASFQQIRKIPGVVVQDIDVSTCKNPAFAPDGTNLLADNAPRPLACDLKGGVTQCANGTGGMKDVPTAVKPGPTQPGTPGTPGTGTAVPNKPTVPGKPNDPTATTVPGQPEDPTATTIPGEVAPPADCADTGTCDPGTPSDPDAAPAPAVSTILDQSSGWGSAQGLIILIALLTLAAVVAPAFAWRHFSKKAPA